MATLTPLNIRALVEDALVGEIGTYQYGNGQTTLALHIEGTGQYLDLEGNVMPKPDSVNGLEVIIRPATSSDFNPLLGPDYFVIEKGQIILKQHDITKTTINAARLLLPKIARYLSSQTIPRVPRSEALDSIESQTFTFSFFTN
ncbi:MAG: hypothetical protein AAF810_04925 [Cyanobacteria bacterium P01_D01_bin.36]